MESWVSLSLWIGMFGFLKEFRPEDPYITQYLVGPVMNLTEAQVNQQVYPIATYVCLTQLVFVFLLTDWLRYKPVIMMNALCGVISQAILVWGRGLFTIQVMEVFYGTMIACEVAYYTYIYVKVDKRHYQAVTSHMRAAALLGRFLSATTAQTVLLTGLLGIPQLNHLTLAGMTAALLWALFLPSMKHSIYFHQRRPRIQNDIEKHSEISASNSKSEKNLMLKKQRGSKCGNGLRTVWRDLRAAYTNTYIVKWSLWWALATCGYQQVMSYIQLLWQVVVQESGEKEVKYNAATEAAYTVISAVAAFSFGQIQSDWTRHGESLLGACTLCQGALLLWSALTSSIWLCYVIYVLFGMTYHVMMTVSNSEVARHLKSDSYALIFGVNTFIALALQTLLTITVASDTGLALPIRDQIMIYGGYFLALGGAFALKALTTYCCGTSR